MNNQRFEKVVNEQLERCKNLLLKKGKEYDHSTEDRLHVFKVAGQLEGITPGQALAGMMAKHTISIYDLVSSDCQSIALWDEKITDHINYLLLLKALIEEAHDDKSII